MLLRCFPRLKLVSVHLCGMFWTSCAPLKAKQTIGIFPSGYLQHLGNDNPVRAVVVLYCFCVRVWPSRRSSYEGTDCCVCLFIRHVWHTPNTATKFDLSYGKSSLIRYIQSLISRCLGIL